jgi:hypothetical protein
MNNAVNTSAETWDNKPNFTTNPSLFYVSQNKLSGVVLG